jgi:membrane protease YdiL (CAAX protease family)
MVALASLVVCWRAGVFAPVRNPSDRRLAEDESPFRLLLVMVIGVVSGYVLAGLLMVLLHIEPKKTEMQAGALVLSCCFLTMVAARRVSRRDGLQRLGLSPLRIISAIAWGIVAILLTIPLVYAASSLIEFLWLVLRLPKPGTHPILQELTKPGSQRRFLILVATVLAPLTEETFFRGLLQTTLSRLSGLPWISILITALLFASVHMEPAFLFPLFVLGVALGWVYERTGNLWATVVMHGLFNGFQVLMFLKWGQA